MDLAAAAVVCTARRRKEFPPAATSFPSVQTIANSGIFFFFAAKIWALFFLHVYTWCFFSCEINDGT